MEHARTVDSQGRIYQWVDDDLVMFVDPVTGVPKHFGTCATTIMRFDQALEIIKRRNPADIRAVIVKMPCIAKYRVLEEPVPPKIPPFMNPPDGTIDGDGVWRGGEWCPNHPERHGMDHKK